VDLRDRSAVAATVLDATRLVGRPIFFSMAIIVLAFIPVFRPHRPGRQALPSARLHQDLRHGGGNHPVRDSGAGAVHSPHRRQGARRGAESDSCGPLVWVYRPLLDWALGHRVLTLGAALLVLAGALALIPRIGREFMPPLNEGDLMFMPITDPRDPPSPRRSRSRGSRMPAIRSVPEVAAVVAKVSRADTSTDPAPINMTETVVN